MDSEVILVPFHSLYLKDHPDELQRLCELYCSIWEDDAHFGEYRKCPSCGRYFSYRDVTDQGIQRCTECKSQLEHAWYPVTVGINLLEIANDHSFVGVMLMRNEEILGFSWGRLYTATEMKKRIGEPFDFLLGLNSNATHCFYLEELAVSPEVRGQGFGTKLVKKVLTQPFSRYPNVIGALATHTDSPSVPIYQKLGYYKIADIPAGQGRIQMGIARIGNVAMFGSIKF